MTQDRFSGKPIEVDGLLPVYILCDVSQSMGCPTDGQLKPIDAINTGLASILDEIVLQGEVGSDLRLCVMSFSTSARVVLPLSEVTVATKIPTLVAAGVTNLEKAIQKLTETISSDYHTLRAKRHRAYRPVVFVFTDGVPTNEDGTVMTDHSTWKRHLDELRGNEAWNPRIYAYGFGDANEELLRDLVFDRGVPSPVLANRAQMSHENAVKSISELFPSLFSTLTEASNAAASGATDDEITKVFDDAHRPEGFAQSSSARSKASTFWDALD